MVERRKCWDAWGLEEGRDCLGLLDGFEDGKLIV